jgi:hypothetical protein
MPKRGPDCGRQTRSLAVLQTRNQSPTGRPALLVVDVCRQSIGSIRYSTSSRGRACRNPPHLLFRCYRWRAFFLYTNAEGRRPRRFPHSLNNWVVCPQSDRFVGLFAAVSYMAKKKTTRVETLRRAQKATLTDVRRIMATPRVAASARAQRKHLSGEPFWIVMREIDGHDTLLNSRGVKEAM